MKKKFLSLLLALAMCLSLSVPAQAAATDTKPNTLNPNVAGVLTTEDGSQLLIEGALVSTLVKRNGDCEATYQYSIPAAFTRGSGTSSMDEIDSGYASHVYLTLHYNHRNNQTEYLLTRVSGYWVILDSSATVESAFLTYACNCGNIGQYVWDRSVSNNFNIATGFTTYVENYGSGNLGAQLTLNYLIGNSRRWSFTLNNTLFNT